jgi:polyvinyl alcohol dehydrogenase (cytochrome)
VKGIRIGLTLAVGLGLTLTCAALAAKGANFANGTNLMDLLQSVDPRDAPDPQSRQHGAELFAARCAACHENGVNRAPSKIVLALMTPQGVERALSDGVMKPMAQGLSETDRRNVAEYLTRRRSSAAVAPRMCAADASPFDFGEPPPLAGWGFEPGNAHAVTEASAGLDAARAKHLTLKWALAFPNALRARSQPTLGGGAIYVGSHDGSVFALDRKTGCARWIFQAGGEVRTGITLSPWRAGDGAAKPLVLFGDYKGYVYAVDAVTGAQVWKVRPDPHPEATITGAPTLAGNKLLVPVSSNEENSATDPKYPCCSFRGSVVAYDVRTGAKLWQTYMVDPAKPQGLNPAGVQRFTPAGAAIWSSPTVDEKRRRVYVGTGDSYTSPAAPNSDAIVALDLDSGRIIWSRQLTEGDGWNTSCMLPGKVNCTSDGPDYDFGAPPILASSADGQAFLVAGQKSGFVYGMDPETGQVRWKTKVGRGGLGGGVHFGMSAQDGRLFVPISDGGPDKSPEPPRPGLNALDIKTGQILWRYRSEACGDRPFCLPGFGGVPTAAGPLVMAGADDGRLRAFDVRTGAVVWEFDTMRQYQTVNGDVGRGGALAGGVGPIPYHGMLFTPSGQGYGGKMPGNVLLAFGEE